MPTGNVVIVDDSKIMRYLLRGLLEKRGYQVIGEAADGVAALEICRRERPQVLLLDIMMPKLNGLAALREIKAELPHTVVIMITSEATTERIREAVANGADGFITKPYNADKITETISALLP